MCIFALARTTITPSITSLRSCELLQNVYLCISTYNLSESLCYLLSVVNCFKMCIFALARTTWTAKTGASISCELLQNVYLCISTYNSCEIIIFCSIVVNCFKMCIFALARTTGKSYLPVLQQVTRLLYKQKNAKQKESYHNDGTPF